MTDECFDTEWALWVGLGPKGMRTKAAYRAVLDEYKMTDKEFTSASRAAIVECRGAGFPTVGDIIKQLRRPTKYFEPEYALSDSTPEQLERYIKKLEGFYELALVNHKDQPETAGSLIPLRGVVHHQLAKVMLINAECAMGEKLRQKKGPEEKG